MHIEISGPVQKTGDYPFFSVGSRFSGGAGTQLNFTSAEGDGYAAVTGIGDVWTVGYAGTDLVVNSATCTRSNWTVNAASASGTFECKDGFGAKADGTALQGVNIKGNFTANQ
jgi:hypothetical protein